MTTTMLIDDKDYGTLPEQAALVGSLAYDTTAGGFPVRLFHKMRPDRTNYAVQYGKQLDWGLTYEQAATALGQAIMHGLMCDSILNPEA